MSQNEFEDCRNAGELWGRVRKGLGFGDVALYRDEGRRECFLLQWRCTIRRQVYAASFVVSPEEIANAPIDLLAERIVANWKKAARRDAGSDLPKELAE